MSRTYVTDVLTGSSLCVIGSEPHRAAACAPSSTQALPTAAVWARAGFLPTLLTLAPEHPVSAETGECVA
ncbi:hypothetical protein GCM10009823_00170 [Brevibacterium salitolerans]|uniref:Uncharacterized protein n=1 Tax=Brevibacterium salitolerans TaxID=1403566 RepID=A0ABP5HVM2_9MICO